MIFNLFKYPDVKQGLYDASFRISNEFKDDSIRAVEQYRYNAFNYLRDLTIVQSKENKRLILEVKDLCDKAITKEVIHRLNVIVNDRIN